MTSPDAPRLSPVAPPRVFRWGIIGSGAIATDFCHALHRHVPDAVLQHVGARSPASAQALASRFSAVHAGSYDDVVNDPDVDVVYVGTVHSMHRAHALLAIGRGKPVLVEKPFCVNSAETEEVFKAAEGLPPSPLQWRPLRTASLIVDASTLHRQCGTTAVTSSPHAVLCACCR